MFSDQIIFVFFYRVFSFIVKDKGFDNIIQQVFANLIPVTLIIIPPITSVNWAMPS